MPSGSTRLTVAFLYSLPLTVLKSSAKTTEAKRISKARTFEAEGGIIKDINDRALTFSPVRRAHRILSGAWQKLPLVW